MHKTPLHLGAGQGMEFLNNEWDLHNSEVRTESQEEERTAVGGNNEINTGLTQESEQTCLPSLGAENAV